MSDTFYNDFMGAATPVPAKGKKTQLVAAGTSCAASGAYTSSGIINVSRSRYVTLLVDMDAAAIGNVVSLVPLLAYVIDQPGATDDEWFCPTTWDGSVTAGTLTASSLPSGTDFTVSGDFARCLQRATDLRTEPADATTDELRVAIRIAVGEARWLQVLYAEAGVTGTPSSVGLWYVQGA